MHNSISKEKANEPPTKRQKTESSASDSDDQQQDQDRKWSSLEHHAMQFYPAYQPLPSTVRAKLDGKPLEVPVAVEEKLVQWADVAETDFAKPAKIRENAWRCLQPLLVGAGYKA